MIVVIPVKEHDDVGVLLNCSGFPEVRQHGPMIRPALNGTAELGKSNDRYI